MDVLDLHWLKTSINHDVATGDARAVRHDRVVICSTDAAWRMRGKLVQKLQMSCEVNSVCTQSPRWVPETDFVAKEEEMQV